LLTDGFRSTRWSVVFGLVAAITLLERFLTGVYFAGIFVALAGWILCGKTRLPRLRNLVLAGLVMLFLAGPVLWLNRDAIYNYYWVGHITSAEGETRAQGFNVWQSFAFIAGETGRFQLGNWFLWVAGTLTTTLALAAAASRPTKATPPRQMDWLVTSLIFLVMPALALGLHRQKSPYVLGVIVPGVILVLLWLWQRAWLRIDPADPEVRAARPLAVALAVAAGCGFFLQRQLTPPYSAEFVAGATQVNRVTDHIFTTSRRAGLTAPRLSADLWTEYFYPRTLGVLSYERHREWLSFTTMLPVGIIEEQDSFVMERIAQSDFVLLTDDFPENGYYPFDRQMRRLYPAIKEWCEQHLRRVDTFPIFNRRMSLYQRRDLP